MLLTQQEELIARMHEPKKALEEAELEKSRYEIALQDRSEKHAQALEELQEEEDALKVKQREMKKGLVPRSSVVEAKRTLAKLQETLSRYRSTHAALEKKREEDEEVLVRQKPILSFFLNHGVLVFPRRRTRLNDSLQCSGSAIRRTDRV